MSRYKEREIAIQAVGIIEEFGELTMGELIEKLTESMKPSGHDIQILANRNDTYFSQKVRNLRSHQNAIFFHNVYYDANVDKYISKEFAKLKNSVTTEMYFNEVKQKRNKALNFYARKIDFENINKERKLIGDGGELLVYYDQIEFVKKYVPECVGDVRHVSKHDGDGAGFDISSFDINRRLLYIEVKSTTKKKETPFYMSATEYAFMELHKGNYVIARVYDYDVVNKTGKVEYIHGNDIESVFEKEVSSYKIVFKK